MKFKRLPRHIGTIPDGNRRWATNNGLEAQEGHQQGLAPGFLLCEACLTLGIPELTFYNFTQDNAKRPDKQKRAFQQACVDAVKMLSGRDAALLVLGDHDSSVFPPELLRYTTRQEFGKGLMRINFLVNYGWQWDLTEWARGWEGSVKRVTNPLRGIASADIPRIDLVIRWGGRRRLSGFLPLQAIYSDFYVVDDMWPDFRPEHFYAALDWYQNQDITLGG
ncbi:MAG: Trans,polycis-polyprenyl diphosphate synthase ((2Z,6E)-farnesyl diphosphate specific) [Firmicutes bacterium]|nr:Trans,polycis-polyprenyl diphosphate synthase ((2Z,6E)-farnesyl diphosphate specific) [Bacillota bacterium]